MDKRWRKCDEPPREGVFDVGEILTIRNPYPDEMPFPEFGVKKHTFMVEIPDEILREFSQREPELDQPTVVDMSDRNLNPNEPNEQEN